MYMYQQLRLAVLETKNDSSFTKNWSPNLIKAIFITRGSILIAYHTRNPKLIPLDMNVSIPDIQKNGTQGSLHNILTKKQLSCLEEIYVDNAFKNYQGIFNLEYYVQTLVSSISRLRYYGYTNEVDLTEAYSRFNDARINGIKDYAYALDSHRKTQLEIISTNNDDWYKKFNLRPDVYSIDAEKGTLSAWLNLVKKTVGAEMDKKLEVAKEDALLRAYNVISVRDLVNLDSLILLMKLKKVIERGTYGTSSAGKSLHKFICDNPLKAEFPVPKNILTEAMGHDNRSKIMYYVKLLKESGSILESAEGVELEKVIERADSLQGLLNTNTILKRIVASLIELKSIGGLVAVSSMKLGNPNFNSPEEILNWVNVLIGAQQVDTVVEFLITVAGLTKEQLMEVGE